jgi:hypothetical protein
MLVDSARQRLADAWSRRQFTLAGVFDSPHSTEVSKQRLNLLRSNTFDVFEWTLETTFAAPFAVVAVDESMSFVACMNQYATAPIKDFGFDIRPPQSFFFLGQRGDRKTTTEPMPIEHGADM